MELKTIDKEFLNTKDVQNILNIGRETTYKLIRKKDFPKIKVGRSYLIPKLDFERYMSRYLYKEIYL